MQPRKCTKSSILALVSHSQPVERAFDNSAVCFYFENGQLKLHVVWDALRDVKLCESHWIGGAVDRQALRDVFGDRTYGSLEGLPLLHTDRVSPFLRVLNAHAQLAMRNAVERGKTMVGGGGDGWNLKPYGSEENVMSWLETAELGVAPVAIDLTDPSASTSSQG